MNKYLLYEHYTEAGPFFGWVLVKVSPSFDNLINKTDGENILHSRTRTHPEVLDFLDHSQIWKHPNLLNRININGKQFQNLRQLIFFLFDKINQDPSD